MKKFLSVSLSLFILLSSLFMITASAWETPELMLAADYDEDGGVITVEYRLLHFAGTESADLRLKYNTDILDLTEYEAVKMKDVLIEIADSDGSIAILFADMYHVEEEDCEDDGSLTVATFNFGIKDKSAESAVFIAIADSYNMDPDSAEVSLDRATLKLPLTNGSTSASTVEDYSISAENSAQTKSNVNKVITAAIAAAVIFVVLLVVTVVYYRKKKD